MRYKLLLFVTSTFIMIASYLQNTAAQELVYTISADKIIAEWVNSTGILVTPKAKDLVWKAISKDIAEQAKGAGIETGQAQQIAALIAASGYVSVVPGGKYGIWSNGSDRLEVNNPNELAAIAGAVKYVSFGGVISLRPRVKIAVIPVPPRDYSIAIDGDPMDATERSEYVVNEGLVSVVVTRPGHKDCVWSGEVAVHQVKEVNCQM